MRRILALLAVISILLCGCVEQHIVEAPSYAPVTSGSGASARTLSLEEIPAYSGSPYIIIDENLPWFTTEQVTKTSFEYYSELDELGRCGVVYASIGTDIMPTEERGNIGSVKPTGWQIAKYDFVDGKYLYNRCHLIGFQLTGENANTKNLITGTRYLNVQGMLPFENMVADYVKETGNHVMYRVTPIFHGDELVARGVQMEGYSVEDNGEGICFNVYCYNVQPRVEIDYRNGDNCLAVEDAVSSQGEITYILNTNSKKIHLPHCSSVSSISDKNREETSLSKEELIDLGYSPCGSCFS